MSETAAPGVVMPGTDVPADGQLVTVRGRPWIVSDVMTSAVAGGDPTRMTARPQHVVSMISIEDDAAEERIRVVWELESDARAHDRRALPEPANGFDEPAELDAFLDAVRWGAIASADRTALQAPFRAGIKIESYQLDPVVRALSMPRTNLLIADDVGLGKTVEAGLVAQELMLRHRARTMLIVCPAGLVRQWRDEMRDKFGLEFRIVDRALLGELRRERGAYDANPWNHYPRLIVSVDWLKRGRAMRLLRDELPGAPGYPRRFDLLIVDEVHTCAPSGRGRYAVDSQRTAAIRVLAPHCEHRLFLSATPHNGYSESWTALLELLDDQRFARGVPPAEEQVRRVMVRRMKRDLPPRWDGSPQFPKREPGFLEVAYDTSERHAHDLLTRYAASRRGDGTAAAARRTAADFVTGLLKRRLFSSPKAFAGTVAAHLETMTARDSEPEVPEAARRRLLQPFIQRLDETADDDAAYTDTEHDALAAVCKVTEPLTAEERRLLDALSAWASDAQHRPDGKYAAFRAWLDPIVCPDGSAAEWAPDRVIVFTEYRDTQKWLYERLLADGIHKDRIAQLYGGQDDEIRDGIKDVFCEDPELHPVRILLATDAASEGINLQRHCHRVLHWEIPWNPNRLEQRNGRVDRHGQPEPQVDVLHFVPEGWQDADFTTGSLEDELDFLRFASEKVEQIREDLGSAGDVIAACIEAKMLGRRADWADADIEIRERGRRARLKVDRDLEHDLQRCADALTASRTDLNLSPATLERVVRTALRLAHGRELIAAPAPDGLHAACYRLPELPGAWADARNDGLYHPITRDERPVTFDVAAGVDRTDVVPLHLGHRLVQMCLRLLRAELWATAATTAATTGGRGAAKLRRVTARVVPDATLAAPAVLVHGRVVVTGKEGSRLHEQVVVAGGPIEMGTPDKIERVRQDDLEAWLAAATDDVPAPELLDRLAALWPDLEPVLSRRLETRANQRAGAIAALLERRCEEEVAAMRDVFAELDRSIRAALDDTEHWRQASLFDEQPREQMRADHEALVQRLANLPAQAEREEAALRRRYAEPYARRFPAAVTFLVPASLAHPGGTI